MMDKEEYIIDAIDEQITHSKKWAIKGFKYPARDYLTYNLACLMYWEDWKEWLGK